MPNVQLLTLGEGMTILDVWQVMCYCYFSKHNIWGYTHNQMINTKYFVYLEDSLTVHFPQQHLLSSF